MKPEIDKLKSIIDQLLVLHKSNPHLNVSTNEKKRLLLVVKKILKNEVLTDEEWENIKPYNPEPVDKIKQRQNNLHKDRIKQQVRDTDDLNRDRINHTKRLQNETKKLENNLRVAIARIEGKLPAKIVKKLCKKCGKRFTEGEYAHHIKNCGKGKGNIKLKPQF